MFSPPTHGTDLASGVMISAPHAGPYLAAARQLQKALQSVLHSPVELLPDNVNETDGHQVLALGNMMDSTFLRALYFRAYDLTDRAWPGPGGWVLRSVPRSLEGMEHVLVVGVSRAEDVSEAVAALVRAIKTNGPVLPHFHQVQSGEWADLYLDPARKRLEEGDEDLECSTIGGGRGDWAYMREISTIGMLALQTGLAELITMFCRQICRFVDIRWVHRQLEDPPLIHGFIRTLLLPFAMLENHPGLARTHREETLEALLTLYRSTEGAGNTRFLSQVDLNRVRQNHQTRTALDLYYGGRHFHQVHGLEEGVSWMQLAERFFEPQMASNKPVCDSWGHQWAASLFDTADFALAAGRMDYFASRPFLEGVDRALVAHSSLEEAPLQYFLMAAAVTGNDAYLHLCRTPDEKDLAALAVRPHEDPLRTWMIGHEAREPRNIGRVGVASLSRLFYDSMELCEEFSPEGAYVRDVPFEKTFDKIFFRSGWAKEDEYLLLDGISGGSHSYQDGNCIVRFTSGGKSWFGGSSGMDPGSVRDHVGVSVARDGTGPGCESRYAVLRYVKEDEFASVSGTTITYPEQADWDRHIVHSRSGWFLVVDEIWAHCEGEYLVEGRWHVLGEVTRRPGGLIAMQGDARLIMLHQGSDAEGLAPFPSTRPDEGMQWIQRCLRRLQPGEGVRLATLFWADRPDSSDRFDQGWVLKASASGYRVTGDREEFSVSLDANSESPLFEPDRLVLPGRDGMAGSADSAGFRIQAGDLKPMWAGQCNGPVTAFGRLGGGCCAGDGTGGITAFDSRGKARWSTGITGAVRAIAELEDRGVIVGGDGETLCRLDSSGKVLWSHRVTWQPMNWDRWTRRTCAIVSLAACDIDGDGQQEILAGCADRHLYAFDAGGTLLWRTGCQWGPPVCIGVTRMKEKEGVHVLAGMANPAIHACIRVHDAEGVCVQTLSRHDVVCWSIPSWATCLRTVDLDEDGWDEVIFGMDTNHRQLIVYRRDGEILWDADLGSPVSAVESARGRVFAGASNGYVQCFNGDGERLWSRFLVAPVAGLAPTSTGGCVAALEDGIVAGLDAGGNIKTMGRGGERTTATVWTDVGLVVGREDGAVERYEE